MKKCPYCAEEIQDAALVCKHCGRDLQTGAPPAQVQIVQPKKKTGVAAWGCLTIIILMFVGFCASQMGNRPPATTPTTALAPAASSAPATPAPTPADLWSRSETTSKMDDSKGIVFTLEASNEIKGWLARKKPTLILRCQEKKTEAYVVTGMAADIESGDVERHTVQVRFDDGKAQTQRWGQSTDREALFAPSSIPLIRQIAAAKTMRFGFTPFNASPVIAEFNVAGFDKHIKEIATVCGWK